MPRSSQARQDSTETTVAERIAYERKHRGIGVETLARLMTEAGCPINGSAIHRIEKGDPPRRISVDELVALAQVLGVNNVSDLFIPIPLLEQQRGQELADELAKLPRELQAVLARLVAVRVEYVELTTRNAELAKYAKNHELAITGGVAVPPLTRDDFEGALWGHEVGLVNVVVDRLFREVLQPLVRDIVSARTGD